MELRNIRFTLSTIHKLSRDPEILKCIFLFIVFMLVLFFVPSGW
ncbi:MAG: hypothetical protein K0Q87_3104 [Neobacillus sp.]|jgi:hypothetical protein|nr:hypothetical protein [Neobacillus sp.]